MNASSLKSKSQTTSVRALVEEIEARIKALPELKTQNVRNVRREWPKKSLGVATDLAFNKVQTLGLSAGLVDTKICAVDEVWSGLRFVFRLKDRSRLMQRSKD